MYEDLAYGTAIFVVQISFLLFYRRIFTFQNNRFKWSVLAVGVFAFCVWIAVFFATVFHCHPVEFHWDFTIPGGYCGDPQRIFLTGLGLNLLTDIFIVILPIPMIWRIQITPAEKIAISGAFLLGGLFVSLPNHRLFVSLLADNDHHPQHLCRQPHPPPLPHQR